MLGLPSPSLTSRRGGERADIWPRTEAHPSSPCAMLHVCAALCSDEFLALAIWTSPQFGFDGSHAELRPSSSCCSKPSEPRFLVDECREKPTVSRACYYVHDERRPSRNVKGSAKLMRFPHQALTAAESWRTSRPWVAADDVHGAGFLSTLIVSWAQNRRTHERADGAGGEHPQQGCLILRDPLHSLAQR